VTQGGPKVATLGGTEAALHGAQVVAAATLEEALASDADAVLVSVTELRRLLSGAADGRMSELRHALNNDLTAVLGFAQILVMRRQELSEPVYKRAERIFEHAKKMSARLARPGA
jgi:signal transduction histidine kinase